MNALRIVVVSDLHKDHELYQVLDKEMREVIFGPQTYEVCYKWLGQQTQLELQCQECGS